MARGLTLVELLVVIVILATITAAALPILTPSTTERRIREGARAVNTYITQAQSKAIATQRPYGIALKRLSSETGNAADRGVCLEVVAVEQPVPYAGFDENSRMRVALEYINGTLTGRLFVDFITRGNTNDPNNDNLPPGWDADLVPTDVIRIGDVVELLGTHYRIVDTVPADQYNRQTGFVAGNSANLSQVFGLVVVPLNNTGQTLQPVYDGQGRRVDPATGLKLSEGWLDQYHRGRGGDPTALAVSQPVYPYWTEPAAYKIHRQPVPTAAEPLQLPEAIAIDLEASGIVGDLPLHLTDGNETSPSLFETPDDAPVYIMFSPEGYIERVQHRRYLPDNNNNLVNSVLRTTPTANVALLIGRRENIPAPTTAITGTTETQLEEAKATRNWLNLESRWVVVGAQTGSVATTENAFVDTTTLATIDFDSNGDTELNRRRTQIQAAREFAREMRRMGGS